MNINSNEQQRIVPQLDTRAAQLGTVRAPIRRFAAKIQRVSDPVRGNEKEE